jgi:formate-dependent phosphoribosylglycinamide formyltransferase (GAR transformylase)
MLVIASRWVTVLTMITLLSSSAFSQEEKAAARLLPGLGPHGVFGTEFVPTPGAVDQPGQSPRPTEGGVTYRPSCLVKHPK